MTSRYGIRIVLADDHRIVRQGIRLLLEDDGFEIVGEAADGIEVFDLVKELQPDVLVTDLRMPGLDEIELTRRVRESFPDVKVIVLSMYAEGPYVRSARVAGASGYVVKDEDAQDLGTAIRRAMNGLSFISGESGQSS